MSDEHTLFDLDAYTTKGAKPYTPRIKRPKPSVETRIVRVNEHWKYTHKSTPSVVHCGHRKDRGAPW